MQIYDFEVSNVRSCDIFFVFQISIPMSVEFEELAKLRDNPSDEQASKYVVYVEIKCQLDATEVFIADLIAC